MILDRIRLSFAGRLIDLLLAETGPEDPFQLKAVDGLGPPPVDVYIQQSLQEGGVYKGRRPQNREITFRIGLNPNYANNESTVDLRKQLYSMLSPNIGDYVWIYLMDTPTTEHSHIYGYVKQFDISQFTIEPEVAITIACVDPYFSGPVKITDLPTGKATFPVTNAGDAPTGFLWEIIFTVNATGLVLELDQPWTAEEAKLDTSYAFKIGDKLQYSTVPGARYLHVIRATDGVDVNIVSTMSADSSWIMLPDGTVNFTCTRTGWNWSRFEYTPQFWGI